MIRAVVPTKPSAYTPVIDLYVQPFVIVVRGIHRAYGLTGGVVAVLAEDWQEASLDVRVVAFPVAFDADPLDRTPFEEPGFFIDRNDRDR